VAFSYQITATGSPTGFGATGLPAGLSVDVISGLISGVPSVVGDFAVTLYATNNAGSASAILNLGIVAPVPPAIVSDPASLTVPAFESATFSVEARGTEPLSYQWWFNDTPIAGEDARSLTLPKVEANQAGNYRVVVTNAFGSATSATAVLTVSAPLLKFVPGSAHMSNGQFEFVIQSEVGRSVEILASTNLRDWTTVVVLNNPTGQIGFRDPTTGLPKRFYRAKLLP
jgi:hypothetical protein